MLFCNVSVKRTNNSCFGWGKHQLLVCNLTALGTNHFILDGLIHQTLVCNLQFQLHSLRIILFWMVYYVNLNFVGLPNFIKLF